MDAHAAGSANTPNKAPTPMSGHSTSINTNPLHTVSSCKAGKTHNHASIIENKAPNIESETVYKLKFPVLQHIQIKFFPQSMREQLNIKIL